MDYEKETEEAVNLFQSVRGQMIVGQALATAIDVMKEVPAPHTETSNIEDMKILLTLFPLGKYIAKVPCKCNGDCGEKNDNS